MEIGKHAKYQKGFMNRGLGISLLFITFLSGEMCSNYWSPRHLNYFRSFIYRLGLVQMNDAVNQIPRKERGRRGSSHG